MTDPTPRPDQTGDRPQVIGEDRAKQGRRGLHILLVLVVSAVLAAIALFALWAGNSWDLAEAEQTQVSEPGDVAGIDEPADVVLQAPEGDEVPPEESRVSEPATQP